MRSINNLFLRAAIIPGILVLLCSVMTSQAQTFPLKVIGYIYADNAPSKNTSVQLYSGSKLIKTCKVENDGWFNAKPEINGNYSIIISKSGFVDFTYAISTQIPDEVAASFSPQELDLGKIHLVKKTADIKVDAYKNPVAKIMYYADKKKFAIDEDYSAKFKASLLEQDIVADKNDDKKIVKDDNVIVDNSPVVEKISDPKLNDEKTEENNTEVNDETTDQDLENLEKQLANNKENNSAKIKTLQDIGRILLQKNEPEKAILRFNEALAILADKNDLKASADVLNDLAYANFEAGKSDESINNLKEAASKRKLAGDIEGEAETLLQLGGLFKDLFRYNEAIKNIETGLEYHKKNGDKIVQSVILNTLGNLYEKNGNFAKAIEQYENAFKIDSELGNMAEAASSLNNIGIAQYLSGNFEKAVDAYMQSIALLEKLGKNKEISASYNNLGNVEYSLDKFSEALDYYMKSVEMKENISYDEGMALTYYNMGNVHQMLKNMTVALEFYSKSLKIAEQKGQEELAYRNYKAIAEVYNILNDCKNAYEYYKLYSESKFNQIEDIDFKQINETQPHAGLYDKERVKEISKLKSEISMQQMLTGFQAKIQQLELSKKNEQINKMENRSGASTEMSMQTKLYHVGGALLLLIMLIIIILQKRKIAKKN